MFGFRDSDRDKILRRHTDSLNRPLENRPLSRSLEENMAAMEELFRDVDLLRVRPFSSRRDSRVRFCLFFSDGMTSAAIINESILRPLMRAEHLVPGPGLLEAARRTAVENSEAAPSGSLREIAEAVAGGDAVLFAEGEDQALILNSKGFQTRSVSEPDNERTLNGPREGFTESIMLNLSLLRRKVRSPGLKMKFRSLGRRTRTRVCVCYLAGIVNPRLLSELERRLSKIDMDAVLDSNYIAELIRDARRSPFRTVGSTQRPDTLAGKLLEGRIAVLVDGSPDALTLPYLFIENFQTGEDYYLNFYYSSLSRLLRIAGFLLTVAVPAFYVAVEAYHPELLTTPLLVNITAERQNVPLPAALEAFVMLFVFDLLRETGIRMSSGIGQALSIVGGLVIGQAAVEAKLVSAPMIIVVALTGITGLLVPRLDAAIPWVRVFLLALASCFGLAGLTAGASAVLIHLLGLRSLGMPHVLFPARTELSEAKDLPVRAPWWRMLRRTPGLAMDSVRMTLPEETDHE